MAKQAHHVARTGVPGFPGPARPHGGAQAGGTQTVGLHHSQETLGLGAPPLWGKPAFVPRGDHTLSKANLYKDKLKTQPRQGADKQSMQTASLMAHLPSGSGPNSDFHPSLPFGPPL